MITPLRKWLTKTRAGEARYLYPTSTLSVYMRRDFHVLGEGAARRAVRCVTIASVTHSASEHTGKGEFTKFLTALETMLKSDLALRGTAEVVFIENVLETRFGKFFERRGYAKVPQYGLFDDAPNMPNCYYKRISSL